MDTLWIQINLRSFINQMDASSWFMAPFWFKCRYFCNVVWLWQRYKYTVDISTMISPKSFLICYLPKPQKYCPNNHKRRVAGGHDNIPPTLNIILPVPFITDDPLVIKWYMAPGRAPRCTGWALQHSVRVIKLQCGVLSFLLDVPSGIPAPGTQPGQRNTAFNNARNISEP